MNTKLIDTKAKNKELTTRLHRLTSNNKSVSRFKIFYLHTYMQNGIVFCALHVVHAVLIILLVIFMQANLTIDEYEKTIASLNDKLSEAEASAEQRRQQVSLLITREKKALKEKEELNRLLHKAKYQMAQSLKYATDHNYACYCLKLFFSVADASFFGMDHTHLCSSSKIAEFYGQSHDELSTSSTKTIDAQLPEFIINFSFVMKKIKLL